MMMREKGKAEAKRSEPKRNENLRRRNNRTSLKEGYVTRRKRSQNGISGPNWIDTYADMVTLLLTFFVLLFAMSSISEEKWRMLVEAFTGPDEQSQVQIVDTTEEAIDMDGMLDPAGSGQSVTEVPESPDEIANFEDLYAYLNTYIIENDLQSDVQIYDGDGYTFITFRNDILFDGNSSYLKWEGKVILDVLSDALVNVADQVGAIRYEGHTARAGTEYSETQSLFDRQLSSDRAVNVLYYMQCKDLIPPEKLTSTGHGEFKPLVPHDGTEATRIINRRVEIIIIEEGSSEKSLDEIYKEIYGEYPVTSESN